MKPTRRVYSLAPMSMRGLPARIIAKIKVDPITGCWIWCGSIEHHGYGRVKYGSPSRPLYVHRVVWLLLRGLMPRGCYELDHCCRERGPSLVNNRACCNPRHLRPTTRARNVAGSDWQRPRDAAGVWTCKRKRKKRAATAA